MQQQELKLDHFRSGNWGEMVSMVASYRWTEEESDRMEVGGMEKEGVFSVAGSQLSFCHRRHGPVRWYLS